MKYFVAFLVSLLLFACGGGDDPTLSPASAHKNATTALVEPQNGWWWNPAESGSGYSIELQGNQIFMAAYLYEANGLATWYTSGLTLQSSGAYSGAVQRYSGGQTLLGTYKAPASTTSVVANALLSFNTASTGTLTITFADGSPSRTVALQRFAFAAGAPSNGFFDNGWWWNQAESGRGYFIEVQGSVAFIGSYMYDSTGQPTWYVSAAALQGSQTLSGALDQYSSGQSLGGSYKAPTKAAVGPGTMAFNFTSRTTANMILPNGKTVALKRFIFNAPSYAISGTVFGLTGNGLVLQDNGGDNISVTNNGNIIFPTLLPTGSVYSVTVFAPPSGQSCTVTNGTGAVNNVNVGDVVVSCVNTSTPLACDAGGGGGTNGRYLYDPNNWFTYQLSTSAANALDIATLGWGAAYTGPAGSYTGSMLATLWAVKSSYSGGSIYGTVLGNFIPNFTGTGAYSTRQIWAGGYSLNTIVSSAASYNPSVGDYCLVVTLSEYMPGACTPNPNGYCIVDWLQFSPYVTFH